MGVLTREDAQEVLGRAFDECLNYGPTLQHYQKASDLIDRIRDEDSPGDHQLTAKATHVSYLPLPYLTNVGSARILSHRRHPPRPEIRPGF